MTYFSFIPRFEDYGRNVILYTQNNRNESKMQKAESYSLSIKQELRASGDIPNDSAIERAARSRQGYSSDDY